MKWRYMIGAQGLRILPVSGAFSIRHFGNVVRATWQHATLHRYINRSTLTLQIYLVEARGRGTTVPRSTCNPAYSGRSVFRDHATHCRAGARPISAGPVRRTTPTDRDAQYTSLSVRQRRNRSVRDRNRSTRLQLIAYLLTTAR